MDVHITLVAIVLAVLLLYEWGFLEWDRLKQLYYWLCYYLSRWL